MGCLRYGSGLVFSHLSETCTRRVGWTGRHGFCFVIYSPPPLLSSANQLRFLVFFDSQLPLPSPFLLVSLNPLNIFESSSVACLKSSPCPLVELQAATRPIQIMQPTPIQTGRVTSCRPGHAAHLLRHCIKATRLLDLPRSQSTSLLLRCVLWGLPLDGRIVAIHQWSVTHL